MYVFVVISDRTNGCFGVFINEEIAYRDIIAVYGSGVKHIDRANRKVTMKDGETLYLQSRKVHES